MAKKRTRSKKPASAASPVVATKAPPRAGQVVTLRAESPAFWFGYEVSWAKLVVTRVVLFGLLALDAILQIRHAPRYGAGGFNVAQIPGLDALGPTRASYEIAQLVSAYLFAIAALGVATRYVLPCVTAIYSWLYFTSQLDSYQHHYLVALVLGIACFVPWQRPANAQPGTMIRTWAVRLILVQLAILYLWAAISKMDAAWLDGRTLAGQITGPLRSLVDSSVGIKAAARFAIFTELALALTIWWRPAWFIALPLGLLFHAGILLSGLEIGLFAYLMLALYVLVVPDRFWVRLGETGPLQAVSRALGKLRVDRDLMTVLTIVIAAVAGVAIAALTRFDHAIPIAIGLALVPVVVLVAARIRGGSDGRLAGIAHALAIALWLVVDRSSTVAVDYYRFWGGTSRRLGDLESSERAYRQLVEIAPTDSNGHYQLGRVLLTRGDETRGLAELRLAQAEETARARSYIAEARYLAGKGRMPEAIEKAREATYAEPASQEAIDLLDSLTGAKKAAAPGAAHDDDDDQP
ncbi:hypothetical protein BH11MYX3_BH11MYX3_01180 [soil metagenome]